MKTDNVYEITTVDDEVRKLYRGCVPRFTTDNDLSIEDRGPRGTISTW